VWYQIGPIWSILLVHLVYIAISRGTSFGKISVYSAEIGGFIGEKDGPSPRSSAASAQVQEERQALPPRGTTQVWR